MKKKNTLNAKFRKACKKADKQLDEILSLSQSLNDRADSMIKQLNNTIEKMNKHNEVMDGLFKKLGVFRNEKDECSCTNGAAARGMGGKCIHGKYVGVYDQT